VFFTCCLNKTSQRPETKLPSTYQTFTLVWTPILAWFRELLFWGYKGGWLKLVGPNMGKKHFRQNTFCNIS
jgi:hypothetical protein